MSTPSPELLAIFREEARDCVTRLMKGLLELESAAPGAATTDSVRTLFRLAHTIKGSASTVGRPDIVAVAHAVESCLDRVRKQELSPSRSLVDAALRALDAISLGLERPLTAEDLAAPLTALETVAPGASAPPPGARSAVQAHPALADAFVRIPAGVLETISYRVDEIVAAKLRLEFQRGQVEDAEIALDSAIAAVRSGLSPKRALEDLRRRLESIRRQVSLDVQSVGVLAHELQEDLKDVRMVPVGPMLDPLRRVVRELAQSLGKDATLEIVGQDVRVDKQLMELLRDPLVHLLRNAVDHGIESPAVRAAARKRGQGLVRITAEARDAQIWLEITDDGHGIDARQLRRVAVERRALDPERAEALSDREALNLIFQPGFSTAAEVTEVSGRGVGLDVVREAVARLGGKIEFYSTLGAGTTFQLSLPLTLAASRGVVVRVGRQAFCIPASAVEEVVAIEPEEVDTSDGGPAVERRRQAVPFVHLRDLLESRAASRPERRLYVVILAVSDRRLALGVDELVGQQEVVVKALAAGTPRLPMVAGATGLADGTLVAVLEPAALMESARAWPRAAPDPRAGEQRCVLVVDDTLTTRTLIGALLERAGYEVLLAPDAERALRIALERPLDGIVTDVEMPGMTGLEMLRRLRGTAEHRITPAIVLSSLPPPDGAPADLGPTRWVTKSSFDEGGLLALFESAFSGPSSSGAPAPRVDLRRSPSPRSAGSS